MPGAQEDSESLLSSQVSEDVPVRLKNEKDLENEQEITKLKESIQEERICKWWSGQ